MEHHYSVSIPSRWDIPSVSRTSLMETSATPELSTIDDNDHLPFPTGPYDSKETSSLGTEEPSPYLSTSRTDAPPIFVSIDPSSSQHDVSFFPILTNIASTNSVYSESLYSTVTDNTLTIVPVRTQLYLNLWSRLIKRYSLLQLTRPIMTICQFQVTGTRQ